MIILANLILNVSKIASTRMRRCDRRATATQFTSRRVAFGRTRKSVRVFRGKNVRRKSDWQHRAAFESYEEKCRACQRVTIHHLSPIVIRAWARRETRSFVRWLDIALRALGAIRDASRAWLIARVGSVSGMEVYRAHQSACGVRLGAFAVTDTRVAVHICAIVSRRFAPRFGSVSIRRTDAICRCSRRVPLAGSKRAWLRSSDGSVE